MAGTRESSQRWSSGFLEAMGMAGSRRRRGEAHQEKAEGGAGIWQQLSQKDDEGSGSCWPARGGGEAREEASRHWGLGRGGRGTKG